MSEHQVVALAGVFILLYLYLRYRVAHLVHPFRLDLIDRADRLLSKDDLREDDREFLNRGLDVAMSARAAWLLAISMLPFALISMFRRLFVGRGKVSVAEHRPHRRELGDFTARLMISILASSPLAALICLISFLLGWVMLPSTVNSLKWLIQWTSRDDHMPQLKQATIKPS